MATPVPADTAPEVRQPVQSLRPIAVALLGAGVVGSAIARRLPGDPGGAGASPRQDAPPLRLVAALVRDPHKPRDAALAACVTSDADQLFRVRPDVLVEVLGGVEPAFTLIRRALSLGIPVVTANKSLIAARGAELDRAAADAGVPLLYEASVLAGVPFLGALAERPRASNASRIAGILNGTSNAVLDAVGAGAPFAVALADAQRRGLAEPDPGHDVRGIDAAEKLAILVRLIGWGEIDAGTIEASGIDALGPADLAAARAFDGVVKPVVFAERQGDAVAAFSGPAFVPRAHRLARVDGSDNAVVLTTPHGDVVHSGPGAGPDATADTVLDDVAEAARGRRRGPPAIGGARVSPARTSWFVRLSAAGALPPPEEVADFLGAHGIWLRRSSVAVRTSHHLTYPCSRARLRRALDALAYASGTESLPLRALEAGE